MCSLNGANLGILGAIGTIGHSGACILFGAGGMLLVADTAATLILMAKRVSEFKHSRKLLCPLDESRGADFKTRIEDNIGAIKRIVREVFVTIATT